MADVVRRERGQVLATLTRYLGDLDLAEEAVQDAAVAALRRWPLDGTPHNPGAWLTTVARNSALDRLRREATRSAREEAAMSDLARDDYPETGPSVLQDDLLRLIFTCCHPALSREARVALALRSLCGLTTPEIARLFLTSEATVAQRIVRAKRKIAAANIPYRVPTDSELPDRLPAVLAVIYLVFTEAHHSGFASKLVRVDLGDEAIRLGRLLAGLMPDEPECSGLLALMLATHARRAARLDAEGHLVLLADQDRGVWESSEIAEAEALIANWGKRRLGPYAIQALIATTHARATTAEATDWARIADLYEVLEQVAPTPAVRVNRAVAVAEARGPAAGLKVLDRVEEVAGWHLYHAARADMLRRLARTDEAAAAYRAALACDTNDIDRAFLLRRLNEIRPNGEGR